MIRKLIKHGESSLTISLPRSYVKENNLNKGDEIDVKEADNGLFISTKRKKELKAISINVSKQLSVIKKILGAAYKTGYDEVNIQFSSFEELKEIKLTLQSQFEGYEIIRQGKSNIQIKKISEDEFSQFNNVIRRFFLIIKNMATDAQEAIKKNDLEWLKQISLMKYEADHLADYCRRAINTKFKSDYKRLAPLYVIIEEIEKVSDHMKELCEYISTKKLKTSKETKKILKETISFFNTFYSIFFKFELGNMSGFKETKDGIQKMIDLSLKKATKEELKAIMILDRLLNIIYSLNGPLMATYI